MNGSEGPRRPSRWIGPALVAVAFFAVILTLGRVVNPVPAFLGAVLVSLAIAIVGAVAGGAGWDIRPSRPTFRFFVGILLWLAAVGVVAYLGATWSDFGSP